MPALSSSPSVCDPCLGDGPVPANEAPAVQTQSLPAGVDRRHFAREDQQTVATLQPANGDASADRQVLVRNLSLGGVGFRAGCRFQAGETYRITLTSGALFLNARLRIVNCRARTDGTFDVGAAFC